MDKIYTKINFVNDQTTASAETFSPMDDAIDAIDNRVIELNTSIEETADDIETVDEKVNDLSSVVTANKTYLDEKVSEIYTSMANNDDLLYQKIDETEESLENLITQIPKFAIVVVQTLPTENISPTTVYLVPNNLPGTNDLYDEYIYVNSKWEHLGSQTIDLSNYMPKSGGTFTGAIFGNYEEEDNWMIDPNGEAEFYQVRVGSGGIEGNLDGIASKATADGDGNDISSTYAKKADEPSEETIDIDFSNLFN